MLAAAGFQERRVVRALRAVRGPTDGLASADELRRGNCVRGVARLLFAVEGFDCLRSMLRYSVQGAAAVRSEDQLPFARSDRARTTGTH